jgi:hypothetical protein
VAVSVLFPCVFNVTLHVPADTVPTQVSTPSLTVTLPVGVPLPGAVTETVKFTVTGCPAVEGSGLSRVIAVVVLALLTVCETPADVEARKLALPE